MTRRRRLLALALLIALAAGAAKAEPRGLEGAPPSFRAWIESLPEGQRRTALRRLGDMPIHRRNVLFHRWEALEEGERRAFQQRLEGRLERGESDRAALRERVERMSPETRERLAPLVRRWRDMDPADRRRMRERLERFRTLSPEDQQALVERRFAGKPEAERARILQALREASEALPERPLLEGAETPQTPPEPD
jgi:hypothetical protein